MNRRRVLTGLVGLALTGGSVWAVEEGLPTGGSGTGSDGPSVQVETIDAQGSAAGHTQVPVQGTPTLIDLFATWCAPCKEEMKILSRIHPEYAGDVAFVSVTNERVGGTLSKDDISKWWRKHDGNWTVGLDPESDLMSTLGANGLPYMALADASGRIQWHHSGPTDAATLRTQLESVVDK
ncbi:MAG: TlpA family protein disulfide reductase [Halorientalis sp.]